MCLSSYFWAFCGPSEPQEPLYEPLACLAISGHSVAPVSHRSHYMDHMQSYIYTGILGPQLALGATIYNRHVHLVITRLSGSPISRRSHYMNHMSNSHFQTFCVPSEPHLSYFWAFWGPSEPQEPLYEPHAKLHLYGHSGSPVSFGSHEISPSCTSRHSQSVGVWAIGATRWTICGSGLFRTFGDPIEPRGHCISVSCTSRHFNSSGSSVSHRSHYMNYT